MTDQYKALVNTLKNLRGIHISGGRKSSNQEPELSTMTGSAIGSEVTGTASVPVVVVEEADSQRAELLRWKRKKGIVGGMSSNVVVLEIPTKARVMLYFKLVKRLTITISCTYLGPMIGLRWRQLGSRSWPHAISKSGVRYI